MQCCHNSNDIPHRNKNNLQIIKKKKNPQISKTILRKYSSAGDITMPVFELHNRAIVTKTTWHWHQDRCIDQRNRIQEPEISPIATVILFLANRPKTYFGKRQPFQQMVRIKLNIHIQKTEFRPLSLNLYKNQLK
jgi:hypothetical protein